MADRHPGRFVTLLEAPEAERPNTVKSALGLLEFDFEGDPEDPLRGASDPAQALRRATFKERIKLWLNRQL